MKSSSPPASNAKSPSRQDHGGEKPHQSRPVPGPQDPRGLRLRPPALPQTRRDRPPRHPRLRRGPQDNVVFLGPPGTGKTHLAIGLGIRACQAGHRVAFATAAEWVARLGDAHPPRPAPRRAHPPRPRPAAHHRRSRLHPLRRPKPPTCSSSSSPPATNEPRSSSPRNKPFGRWGEVFGDATVAAAMIDRLVHHAEVVDLKGDSYRLKDRDLGRVPTDDTA